MKLKITTNKVYGLTLSKPLIKLIERSERERHQANEELAEDINLMAARYLAKTK
jgi:hypothetical protein